MSLKVKVFCLIIVIVGTEAQCPSVAVKPMAGFNGTQFLGTHKDLQRYSGLNKFMGTCAVSNIKIVNKTHASGTYKAKLGILPLNLEGFLDAKNMNGVMKYQMTVFFSKYLFIVPSTFIKFMIKFTFFFFLKPRSI
jgi:hypothetical protein